MKCFWWEKMVFYDNDNRQNEQQLPTGRKKASLMSLSKIIFYRKWNYDIKSYEGTENLLESFQKK